MTSNIDHVSASIHAMRMQEETAYRCETCLPQYQATSVKKSAPVDADCRTKMIKWCYQIVDYCKFNRETVSISFSYLDRFLLTSSGQGVARTRKAYQLAAMACLYTAVKLHEPEAIDPKVMADLSRGVYSETQITDMEFRILSALQWRVNPPTPLAFVRHFMSLASSQPGFDQQVFQHAGYQTELALSDYYFVNVNASTLALAALSNALDENQNMSQSLKNFYLSLITNVCSIDKDSVEVKDCRNRLCAILSRQSGSKNCTASSSTSMTSSASSSKTLERRSSWKESPRGVAEA